MKMILFLLVFYFSNCQSIQETTRNWWDDLTGVQKIENKSQNPEMDESEERKKQYDKYEDDMDVYRVLRD